MYMKSKFISICKSIKKKKKKTFDLATYYTAIDDSQLNYASVKDGGPNISFFS